MSLLISLLKKQILLNSLILMKLNRIYAHLEVEWDLKPFDDINKKYQDIEEICAELHHQDQKYLKRGVN